ncbi:MAG: protein-disulfide reductase DsbD domain-containing protein, partial [Vicinamibacterales bacterium]
MHRQLTAAALLLLALPVCALAQLRPPRAEVAALVERDGVEPGGTARVALSALLPEGLHANSNEPRDPLLIAMELTPEPPAGVTVEEIVFPEATDLRQNGVETPLSVFEREFVVGASLRIDPSVAPGEITVPVTFRYQACDETQCYFPVNESLTWKLRVVPPGTAVASRHAAVFGAVAWGTGEKPAAAVPPPAAAESAPLAAPSSPEELFAALDEFDTRGTTAGYLNSADFLQWVRNAEAG